MVAETHSLMHTDRYGVGRMSFVLRLLSSSAVVAQQPPCGRVHRNLPIDDRRDRQVYFPLHDVVLTHARSAPAADSHGVYVTSR